MHLYILLSDRVLVSSLFLLFFFFKQKTAYEMRISDWSSDVCSSDLRIKGTAGHVQDRRDAFDIAATGKIKRRIDLTFAGEANPPFRQFKGTARKTIGAAHQAYIGAARSASHRSGRSEEHTSELQSLMRISYAVFCLKTKNTKHQPLRIPRPQST